MELLRKRYLISEKEFEILKLKFPKLNFRELDINSYRDEKMDVTVSIIDGSPLDESFELNFRLKLDESLCDVHEKILTNIDFSEYCFVDEEKEKLEKKFNICIERIEYFIETGKKYFYLKKDKGAGRLPCAPVDSVRNGSKYKCFIIKENYFMVEVKKFV